MLILRCDAAPDIGTGHFFRLLSLAEYADEQGVDTEILMCDPPAGLKDQATAHGIACSEMPEDAGSRKDATYLADFAAEHEAAAIVVDGYHFAPEYYETIGDDRWTVAAIDDICHQWFPVDVLINVNLDADQLDYQTPPSTERLLGVEYTLMRRQFRHKRRQIEQRGGPDTPSRVEHTLVFMGGADPSNETAKVLDGLGRVGYDSLVNVVIGPSNPHGDSIRRAGGRLEAEVQYRQNVTDMADLIAGHHLSVNAGGGTSWEMACLGVPMIQIVVADNQSGIVQGLSSRNISTSLGWRKDVTAQTIERVFRKVNNAPERRERQASLGMDLIDGRGVERVLQRVLR